MASKETKKWEQPINPEWIKEGIDDRAIVWADDFGKWLSDGIKRKPNGEGIEQRDRNNNQPKKDKKGNPIYEKQSPLSTSQLRKFFGQIRKIQADLQLRKEFSKQELLLLKPKLAYQVGREKDEHGKIKDFFEQLSTAIDHIENKDHFKNFINLVEAIVAYHKKYEGDKELIYDDNE